jgi:hypothetical protein
MKHVRDLGEHAKATASTLSAVGHAKRVLCFMVTMAMATGASSGTSAVALRAEDEKCPAGAVQRDYGSILLMLSLLFLLGLLCGIALTCRCMLPAPPAPRTRVALLDKQCQAQTTYTWKATTPRFKPLAEAAHG